MIGAKIRFEDNSFLVLLQLLLFLVFASRASHIEGVLELRLSKFRGSCI